MSIDEQIEAAWKETPRVGRYPSGDYSNTQMSQAEYKGFTSGYRAALRSLYVEVKPEDVLSGVDYWVLKDGEWRDAWWFSDRLALGEARECEKILRLSLPSPSTIFGEGV